jgi:hypothetical protein
MIVGRVLDTVIIFLPLSPLSTQASALVILSPAGAKDLLLFSVGPPGEGLL